MKMNTSTKVGIGLTHIIKNMQTETPKIHDYSPMPFGRYLGKAMIDVPAKYLLWLFDNGGCDHAGVREYINENLAVLKKEAGIK